MATRLLSCSSRLARLARYAVVILVERRTVGRVGLGNVPAAISMGLGAVLVNDLWRIRIVADVGDGWMIWSCGKRISPPEGHNDDRKEGD